MRSSSRPSVLLQISALAWLLFGCGSPVTATTTTRPDGVAQAVSDGPGCHLTDGTTAARGAVAPSTDGTNTCTCGATQWSCTELAIHPGPSTTAPRAHDDVTGACTVTDGTVAAPGSNLPSDDGCNTCTCGAGGWACTEMDCVN